MSLMADIFGNSLTFLYQGAKVVRVTRILFCEIQICPKWKNEHTEFLMGSEGHKGRGRREICQKVFLVFAMQIFY